MSFLDIHQETDAVLCHFHPVRNAAVQQAGLHFHSFELPDGNIIPLPDAVGMDFLNDGVDHVLLEPFHSERHALDDHGAAEHIGDQGRKAVAFRKDQPAAAQVGESPAVFNGLVNTPEDKGAVNLLILPGENPERDLAVRVVERFCQETPLVGIDADHITGSTGPFRMMDITAENPGMPGVYALFLAGNQINLGCHMLS